MQFLPTTVLALCVYTVKLTVGQQQWAATFSGLSVITYLIAWCHNPEDCNANILLVVASCT